MSLQAGVYHLTSCPVCYRSVDEALAHEVRDGMKLHASCSVDYDEAKELIERTIERLPDLERPQLICVQCGRLESQAGKTCESEDAPLGCHVYAEISS